MFEGDSSNQIKELACIVLCSIPLQILSSVSLTLFTFPLSNPSPHLSAPERTYSCLDTPNASLPCFTSIAQPAPHIPRCHSPGTVFSHPHTTPHRVLPYIPPSQPPPHVLDKHEQGVLI